MNNWYVLQVHTGHEISIRDRLKALGITASAPREIVSERKGGKWRERVRVILPGYVFVSFDWSADTYYLVTAQPHITCFLGSGGFPEPLPEAEALLWTSLAPSGDPPGISEIMMEGDTVRVLSGSLRGLSGNILSVNKRQRRAKVKVSLYGETKIVSMSVNVLTKSR